MEIDDSLEKIFSLIEKRDKWEIDNITFRRDVNKILLDLITNYRLNNKLVKIPEDPELQYYLLLIKNKNLDKLKRIFDASIGE